MFKFIILSALVAAAVAINIPFEGCDGWPMPLSVEVPECNSSPCGFGDGDRFTVNFSFDAATATNALPISVWIENNGAVAEFPLPTGDACAVVEGGCPIASGPNTASFPMVASGLPDGATTITVELSDDAGNQVACAKVTTSFN